jgi:hypothetical protein
MLKRPRPRFITQNNRLPQDGRTTTKPKSCLHPEKTGLTGRRQPDQLLSGAEPLCMPAFDPTPGLLPREVQRPCMPLLLLFALLDQNITSNHDHISHTNTPATAFPCISGRPMSPAAACAATNGCNGWSKKGRRMPHNLEGIYRREKQKPNRRPFGSSLRPKSRTVFRPRLARRPTCSLQLRF